MTSGEDPLVYGRCGPYLMVVIRRSERLLLEDNIYDFLTVISK